MHINPIFAIDGYKLGHRAQYPKGTTRIFGNFTPRTNKHFKSPFFNSKAGSPLIWAGTQAFLLQWFIDEFKENFFEKPRKEVVEEFKAFCDEYIGPDAVSEDGVEALHKLGFLPLRIKSIPEGSMVMMGTPVLTVINTLPDFYWLVNFFETLMSAELWPVATAATIAFNYKCIGTYWSHITCDNNDHIPYQFHDFSARGDMGMWACTLIGMGHLMNFRGTDSVFARMRVKEQYSPKGILAQSVNATEHSVMCMGQKESEIDTFRRLINEVYPTGILSIVSDTWDFWKVVTEFLPELKDEIVARQGTVVIRPDSGDPVYILCGRDVVDLSSREHLGEVQTIASKDKHVQAGAVVKYQGEYFDFVDGVLTKIPEHVVAGLISCLWRTFGGTVNKKGYKVLDAHIGAIYGDSITMARAEEIFSRLANKGFASSNVVLGVGSYTYQYVTRDTFGFAMKATWGVVDGKAREVFKDPATDDGTKKSVKGLVTHSVDSSGHWTFKDQCSEEDEAITDLDTVFLNGTLLNRVDLDTIRSRIDSLVGQAVNVRLRLMGS
jgi:nicotinamide phosphoribosyltransferase